MSESHYEGPERRNYDEGWLNGLPNWAKIIGIIGIPGAIAIFLVWMIANELPELVAHANANSNSIAELNRKIQEQQVQADITFRLLQRICSNTAKTEFEKQRCFDQ